MVGGWVVNGKLPVLNGKVSLKVSRMDIQLYKLPPGKTLMVGGTEKFFV